MQDINKQSSSLLMNYFLCLGLLVMVLLSWTISTSHFKSYLLPLFVILPIFLCIILLGQKGRAVLLLKKTQQLYTDTANSLKFEIEDKKTREMTLAISGNNACATCLDNMHIPVPNLLLGDTGICGCCFETGDVYDLELIDFYAANGITDELEIWRNLPRLRCRGVPSTLLYEDNNSFLEHRRLATYTFSDIYREINRHKRNHEVPFDLESKASAE